MKKLPKLERKSVALIVLTIIGFLLRFVGQPDIPAGFHKDEAVIAYSAYSILHTGRDDWGQLLPLHTKALGDYPPAIYNYLTTLMIPLVGFGELAERLPAILFGTLLIPLSFIWVKKLFQDERLALLVSVVVAISPWDVVQSRSGSEPIVALVFSLIAWLTWSSWIKNPKKWHLPLIALASCCALFTYNAVKLALPLLQVLLVWYSWKDIRRKSQVIIFTGLFVALSLASVYLLPGAGDNFAGNSIFQNIQPAGQEYFFREGNMGVPVLLSRIFHNRWTNLATQILGNFGTFLSSNFLFFHAAQPGRYEVPGMGQLLPFFAPFLLIGVFLNKFSGRQRLFLLAWILIALLPAVITTTAFPHVKRSMYVYLPLYIFVAQGLLLTIVWLKKLWLGSFILAGVSIAGLWSFGYFLNQYVVQTQYETILARNYGYKQVYEFVENIEGSYEKIRVFGFEESPEVFYFFYRKIDPRLVQAVADVRPTNVFASAEKRENFLFGKYFFDVASCPNTDSLLSTDLYITTALCLEENGGSISQSAIKKVFAVNYQSGDKRFVLFEKKI